MSQSVQSLTPNEAVFASETPGQEPCVVVAGGKDVASVLTDIDAGQSAIAFAEALTDSGCV